MLILLGSLIAEATTTTEIFGDDVVSTCDPQWYADCEEDWDGFGANDAVDLCELDSVSPSNWFVGITGSSSHNGVSTSLVGAADEVVELSVSVSSFGAGDVGLKFVFKDSLGATLHTKAKQFSVDDDSVYDLTMVGTAPSGVASVEVSVSSANNGLIILVDELEVIHTANDKDKTTDEECEVWAETIEGVYRTRCSGDGGTLVGDCSGVANPTDGGCDIGCTLWCLMPDPPDVEPETDCEAF
ncbi:MAG: hypothetical protein KTR31_28845 [Myxococcales bacterium]|nr:hypothetical protein [Myxococcales bacterium]